MKKYKYKSIMFYLYKNDISKLKEDLFAYFNTKEYRINIDFKENEFIELCINHNNLSVSINFIYTQQFFKNCYVLNDGYYANIFKGSRNILSKVFEMLQSSYPIITKREPLYCHCCGKLIGYTFNDLNEYRENVTPLITNEQQDKDLLYDSYEIPFCYDCHEYFCEDCIICGDDFSNSICEECLDKYDTRTEEEKISDEDDFIKHWAQCKYENCEDGEYFSEQIPMCADCDNYDSCRSYADDSFCGYEMFCDSIVGHGYDSMEDFWECNGI